MEDFLANYGLIAIALFILGDDFGLPFFAPSTLLFTYSALAAVHKELSIYPLIFIALTIPPFANYCLFWAGKNGLRVWLEHHGHKFYLPNHRIKKAEKIMEKHGEKAVFFAACVSTIRPFCSVVAGSLNMNPFKFALYHFLGLCVWATLIIGGGYFFGDNFWYFIKGHWFYIILIIFFCASAFFTWKSFFWNGKK